MPFVFNLQTMSMARRHCRFSLSRPNVVGCGWEVAEWVRKTTPVQEMKKEKELLMKLLDDPEIPTSIRIPQEPHHSHKLLVGAAEMGMKPGRLYWIRRHRHHLSVVPPNLNPKTRKTEPSRDGGRDPPCLHGQMATEARPTGGAADRRRGNPNRLCTLSFSLMWPLKRMKNLAATPHRALLLLAMPPRFRLLLFPFLYKKMVHVIMFLASIKF